MTPSLNVQPAVPLSSTRGSWAEAVAAASATSIAVRIVFRIIVFLSFLDLSFGCGSHLTLIMTATV